MVKIVSWNVNGIRSNILTNPGEKYTYSKSKPKPLEVGNESNFNELVNTYDPDIICIQECRCDEKIFEVISTQFEHKYLNHSTNPQRGRGSGYSGTCIFSKIKPEKVVNGLIYKNYTGEVIQPEGDNEGRCITAYFKDFVIVNVYTPNSGTNEEYRLNTWDNHMYNFLEHLKQHHSKVVFLGDFNVCRESKDIFSGFPSANNRVAGLLPEERENIDKYIQLGYRDSYREKHPLIETAFTWWNPKIKTFRELNKGWRIDYILICSNEDSQEEVCKMADICSEIMGSDHCPIIAEI